MSNRNISCGGKGGRCTRLKSYHLHVPIFLKSGSLNLLEHSESVQACTGIAIRFIIRGNIFFIHSQPTYKIPSNIGPRNAPKRKSFKFFIVGTSVNRFESCIWYITLDTISFSPLFLPCGFSCSVLLSPFQHIALVKPNICREGCLEIEWGCIVGVAPLAKSVGYKYQKFSMAVSKWDASCFRNTRTRRSMYHLAEHRARIMQSFSTSR
jgi:hypothetical protein